MESIKFANMGSNISNILDKIVGNQNLKRLIKYLSQNPLELTEDQPDVEDDELINKNIIIGDIDTTILDTSKVIVFLHPHRGQFDDFTRSDEILAFDIVYPYTHQRLPGTLRYTEIAYEFCKEVDGQQIKCLGAANVKEYETGRLKDHGVFSLYIEIHNKNSIQEKVKIN